MLLEGIAAALEERAALLGIDPSETIYRLKWADVLDVLAEMLAEENVDPDEISDGELTELLAGGQEAAETLPWHNTLSIGVDDAWSKIRPKPANQEDDEGPLVEQHENASRLGDDDWLESAYEDRISGFERDCD